MITGEPPWRIKLANRLPKDSIPTGVCLSCRFYRETLEAGFAVPGWDVFPNLHHGSFQSAIPRHVRVSFFCRYPLSWWF